MIKLFDNFLGALRDCALIVISISGFGLYADLGIDPGKYGCTHLEASQFMFRNKTFDASSYLVLWQVGIAGDKTLTKFSTSKKYKQVLQLYNKQQ